MDAQKLEAVEQALKRVSPRGMTTTTWFYRENAKELTTRVRKEREHGAR